MIGGFALVAAPADYRVTGVKTFIVSHDGVVYEKDLGPKTLEAVPGDGALQPRQDVAPGRRAAGVPGSAGEGRTLARGVCHLRHDGLAASGLEKDCAVTSESPENPAGRAGHRRVLDPAERFSEILFGLIMVLTFTGSLSVAESGHQEVRTMLIGAIGCNLAWGIVDAIMYVLNTLGSRGRGLLLLRSVRSAANAKELQGQFAEAMPAAVLSVMRPEELETIRQRLVAGPEPPPRVRFEREDFRRAFAVFLLVFLSTFPVVLPFVFMQDAMRALRVSNAIAIASLFLAGYSLGKYAGFRPWRSGFVMVAIGVVLVGVTIALGG